MNKVYNYEDIFQEIEGDSENVLMKIPDEIAKEVGFSEGDVVSITVEDGKILIKKKD